MSWTQRGLLVLLVGAALAITGRRSGSVKDEGGGAQSPMTEAVFAGAIPVYPGAKLTDNMGGEYRDDIGGPVTFTSQSWFFEVADPVARVVEFYRKNLPEGFRPAEAEEGATGFEWTPPGAVEGESVTIIVRRGELQIGETVRARTRT